MGCATCLGNKQNSNNNCSPRSSPKILSQQTVQHKQTSFLKNTKEDMPCMMSKIFLRTRCMPCDEICKLM